MSLVLDATVALAACFADEQSAYTDAVVKALSTGEVAYVPCIWPLEVLNGLFIAERRKRVSGEDVSQIIRFLDGFDVEVDGSGSLLVSGEDFRLARQLAVSVYDAAYLGVAQRRGLPLATVDPHLAAAAKKIGTPIFSKR
jgi:predicted nucleic acid-binding protein